MTIKSLLLPNPGDARGGLTFAACFYDVIIRSPELIFNRYLLFPQRNNETYF